MNAFEQFVQNIQKAPSGARVFFDMYPINGYGYIRGIGSTSPVSYIIELDDPVAAGVDPEIYPYPCMVIPGWCVEIL